LPYFFAPYKNKKAPSHNETELNFRGTTQIARQSAPLLP